DFRQRLQDGHERFRKRLDAEANEACTDLFFDVRNALTESVFRLDLRASQIDAPLQETFRIGEAADELVLRSQRFAHRGG
ncbi:MAG TPA: hypothetical protein VF551_00480, partial [Chthoniobacterales bacterium]